LTASDLDPSPFAADWPGAVDLDLEASAQVDGDDIEVTVARLDAGGTLRDMLLSAAVRGRFIQAGGQYTADIEQLEAALGETRIDVRGQVGERADIEWRLVSENLTALLADAAGRIDASGRVVGPIPQVQITADVEG